MATYSFSPESHFVAFEIDLEGFIVSELERASPADCRVRGLPGKAGSSDGASLSRETSLALDGGATQAEFTTSAREKLRYTTTGGTVYDTKSHLTWQQTVSSTKYSWADANMYCAGLGASLGGTGWRLPTLDELKTIVDDSQVNPSIDSTAFPSTPPSRFWSSSSLADSPSDAWVVVFNVGLASKNDVSYTNFVRCVR
jgi:hypothetical protein